MIINIIIFVLELSGIISGKGIEGLFGLPTTKENNLEIIPTTTTSAKPVKTAMGNIVNIDFLLLSDKHNSSL